MYRRQTLTIRFAVAEEFPISKSTTKKPCLISDGLSGCGSGGVYRYTTGNFFPIKAGFPVTIFRTTQGPSATYGISLNRLFLYTLSPRSHFAKHCSEFDKPSILWLSVSSGFIKGAKRSETSKYCSKIPQGKVKRTTSVGDFRNCPPKAPLICLFLRRSRKLS